MKHLKLFEEISPIRMDDDERREYEKNRRKNIKPIDNQLDPFIEEDWDEKDISNTDIEDYLEKNLYSDTKDIMDDNDRKVYMSDVIKVVKNLMGEKR